MHYNKLWKREKNNMINKQKGAVSLFVVIFATLLITIITISFAKLMISDQQQATTADLSQSAYDSAQAGVEDAKRALLNYMSACSSGGPACDTTRDNIDSTECNVSLTDIATPQNGEVMVQQSTGDQDLDQAYTCVTIARNTDDYKGVLQANDSRIIPLTGTSAFSQVLIEWYTAGDMQNPSAVDLKDITTGTPLLSQTGTSGWTVDKPSIMRTQIMQFGNGFKLTDFDASDVGSNANTLFLYPVGTEGTANASIDEETVAGRDTRKKPTGSPVPITCSGNIAGGGFACHAQLILPAPVNPDGDKRTAFLRLTSLYNKSNFRVSLKNSAGDLVQFNNVQPQIDSTGRANDLFRRVQARVEFGDSGFPYPNATVQTAGSLCKIFLVTDIEDDYSNSVNRNNGCSPEPAP